MKYKYKKRNTLVRKFTLPVINEKAKVYHKLININHATTDPPLLRNMSNVDIENITKDQLKLKHPYHNQGVERTIKVISDASARVVGKERRDGVIRQTVKSRKLIKSYNKKSDYVVN